MDNQEVQTTSGPEMDAFVQHIIQWHKQGMQIADHAFNMPNGFSAMYEEDGKKPKRVVFTGDKLSAYKMGVMAAVEAFKQLPFVYSVTEEEPEAANDESSSE